MCWNLLTGSCSAGQVPRVRGCKSSISTKSHLSGHTLTTDLTQTSLLSLSNRSSAVLFVSVNHAYLCIQNRRWKETINTILLGCHYLPYFIGCFYFNIIHLFVGGPYISQSVFSWGESTQIFSGTSTTVNTTCFWAHPGSHPACCGRWCIEKQTWEDRFPFCE